MPRTLNATLDNALTSESFEAYFLVTIREVGFSVLETAIPKKFKLSGINLSVTWPRLTGSIYDGFSRPSDLEFKITRGVTIAGVNYTIDSSYYFGTSQIWDGTYQTITACMLPDLKYTAAGDVTYETLIDDICGNYGKTAVYKSPGEDWQSYQFLGTGKILNLNRANNIINMLKQKYLIFACDNGNNEILFTALGTDPQPATDHTLHIGLFKEFGGDVSTRRRFLYRDEANTTHYDGNANDPLWNLGYLESTASAPSTKLSVPFVLEPIAPHLKYLSFDTFTFNFETNYPETPSLVSTHQMQVEEEYSNEFKLTSWRINLQTYHWSKGTEGGALPGTIEQAAPYTPLNTSQFNNNLDDTVNNLQALADAVDNLTLGSSDEEIADLVGGMFSGNTETGITATYQDADNTVDLVLDNEYLQDTTGAMFTGNTETGITATYEDSDGTIDLVKHSRPEVFEARLSLSSTLAITTADLAAQGTLYLHPYKGEVISLYDGTKWLEHNLNSAISFAFSSLSASNCYDVFVYDNAGTLTLDLVAWTNATTRATALAKQDGVEVKSGATGRKYCGTVYIDASKQATMEWDRVNSTTIVRRHVWNRYNQVWSHARHVSTASHTHSSATYRKWNNGDDLTQEVVIGILEHDVTVFAGGQIEDGGNLDVAINWSSGGGELVDLRNDNTTLISAFTGGGLRRNRITTEGLLSIAVVQAGNGATGTFGSGVLDVAYLS